MSTEAQATTWLITGTSRGIGLELVRQLLESPDNVVVAACRTPDQATILAELKSTARGTLHIVRLDITDFAQVRAAAARELQPILGEAGLDYLINNAAIATEDTAFTLDPETLMRMMRTNVAGPALVSQVCLPFLEKGRKKTVLNISSTGGSIGSIGRIGAKGASYAASKTALNMLTAKQKVERPDLTVIALCPGWVKTDMGGPDAQYEPRESAAGILKVITSVTPSDSGKFLRHNGEEIPW